MDLFPNRWKFQTYCNQNTQFGWIFKYSSEDIRTKFHYNDRRLKGCTSERGQIYDHIQWNLTIKN